MLRVITARFELYCSFSYEVLHTSERNAGVPHGSESCPQSAWVYKDGGMLPSSATLASFPATVKRPSVSTLPGCLAKHSDVLEIETKAI